MIQMTAGDQEERKKDIDLTAKHTPKEAENQKESVQSMFLETLPSTSVDQSEVRRSRHPRVSSSQIDVLGRGSEFSGAVAFFGRGSGSSLAEMQIRETV